MRSFLAQGVGKSDMTDEEVKGVLAYYQIDSLEELFVLELKSNRRCTYCGGGKGTKTGKWSQSGDTIYFGNGTGVYRNGELTVEKEGMTLVMVKVK